MELTGKIIAVMEPRGGISKAGNSWKTQEYVLETHEQYPRKMCFEVFGEEKINQFAIKGGEEVTVSFDIDAREWNGRWFNSIRAWKIERVAVQPAAPGANNTDSLAGLPPVPPESFASNDAADDLPF